MKLFKLLYPYRFHLFLFTQLMVLFGSLLIPFEKLWLQAAEMHEMILSVFMLGNLIAGLTIISRRKRVLYILVFLILGQTILALQPWLYPFLQALKTGVFLLLYMVLLVEVLGQIVRDRTVGTRVILGMFSGYITLGFIGFFLLQLIIQGNPEAIHFTREIPGTEPGDDSQLMYFSFVTLLTIGYGDIIPNAVMAQKTTVLLGLAGQFYLTVVIAFIVGKYLKEK